MADRSTRTLRSVLVAVYLCLGLAALLNAEGLAESAGRQEHGPRRALALALVAPVQALSEALGLDRPRASLRGASARLSQGAVKTAAAIAVSRGEGLDRASQDRPDAAPIDQEPREAPGDDGPIEALPVRERRDVSPHAPLTVWALGDSLLTRPAYALQQRLYQTGPAWADHDSRHSTGLARPDAFDWPAEVEARLETGRPDVVVFMFGANDATAMVREVPYKFLPLEETDWASPDGEWALEYSARVGALMDRMIRAEAEVIWLGIPEVRDPVRERHCAVLNGIFEQAAASRPMVSFLDTRALFSQVGGERSQLRDPDGVHLNEAGAALLADRVFALLDGAWALGSVEE